MQSPWDDVLARLVFDPWLRCFMNFTIANDFPPHSVSVGSFSIFLIIFFVSAACHPWFSARGLGDASRATRLVCVIYWTRVSEAREDHVMAFNSA